MGAAESSLSTVIASSAAIDIRLSAAEQLNGLPTILSSTVATLRSGNISLTQRIGAAEGGDSGDEITAACKRFSRLQAGINRSDG